MSCQGVSVAMAKKKFSELLARAAYGGERFIIERRGRPMAALVGLEDLGSLEDRSVRNSEPQGLSAAAGALADYEDFEKVMAKVYQSRRRSKSRQVKLS